MSYRYVMLECVSSNSSWTTFSPSARMRFARMRAPEWSAKPAPLEIRQERQDSLREKCPPVARQLAGGEE